MGTLTAAMFLTLDGFTETTDGELISPAWSDDMQQYWSGANAHEGQTLLYGRVAYEFNSGYWPTAAADERNPEDYRAFARTMNALPKVVVSDTLTDVGWNTTVARGPLPDVVARLKRDIDGEIVAVGGLSLVASLIEARVVDRYRFLFMPRLAGAGRSVFAAGGPGTELELVSSRTMDTGALLVEYVAR